MVRLRLADLELVRLLPTWMRGDLADAALASGVDEVFRSLAPSLAALSVWDAVAWLPEAYLDELAWALDVRWYDSGAAVETKRRLILESDRVHQTQGTVGAVESVIGAYFGEGRVVEWPRYGGAPHHFKVYTTDPSAVGSNLERFLDMLHKVKRLSSKLDSVMIGLFADLAPRAGVALRATSREVVYLGEGDA